MRPTSSDVNKSDMLRLIIIGIVIIAIIAGIVVTFNFVSFDGDGSPETDKNPYFSKAKLTKSEIEADENTLIILEVTNPSSEFYEVVEIRLSTYYPKSNIEPTNRNIEYISEKTDVSSEETKYSIIVTDPLGLGERESTRTYTFNLTGNLDSGTISSTLKLEASVLADGDEKDKTNFELTISSED